MTEKEFLVKFAKYHKTIKRMPREENRALAIRLFCATNDPYENLEMSGFLQTLADRSGLVEYLEWAIDILTAD